MTDGTVPIGDESSDDAGSLIVPLFPLPNVVLFPKAILPLHIFEERYKAMTADALAGRKRIAMALLQQGWEKDYYSRPAVHPVVCVGRILQHERLEDGRFNFLLQGTHRARIIRELTVRKDGDTADRPYRLAVLQPLEESVADPGEIADRRETLRAAFFESAYAQTPLGEKFGDLITSTLPTGDLVDLMAFHFVEDVAAKQQMLVETSLARRMKLLEKSLEPLTAEAWAGRKVFSKPSLN